jgi:hypothetical protein
VLASVAEQWIAAPFSFAGGLLIGFWIGARFDLRKKRDL